VDEGKRAAEWLAKKTNGKATIIELQGTTGREYRRFGFLDWERMVQEAEELLLRFNLKIDVRQPLSWYSTAISRWLPLPARSVSGPNVPTATVDYRPRKPSDRGML
jgi:hypothetical protein